MLNVLFEDMNLLKNEPVKLCKTIDAKGIVDGAAGLEVHIAGYDKELWLLNSMLA